MRQELADTGEQLVRAQAARDRIALRIQQLSRGIAAAGEPLTGGHGGDPEGNPRGDTALARLTGSLTGDKENAEPGEGGDSDLIHGYLERIARLEKEVRRLRQARARLLSPGLHGAAHASRTARTQTGAVRRGKAVWC